MASSRAQQASEKAARMAAARARQVPDAPQTPPASAPEEVDTAGVPAPAASEPTVAEPAVRGGREARMVRLSVDIAQEVYDQLDDWMRAAARVSGRTRFQRVLVIRALIRELFADEALAERVRVRVDSDMRRSA